MTNSPKLSVFLCHASQDKPVVRELYQRLLAENWLDPWLDEEKMLPGQDWNLEIEKAVEASDAVIVTISSKSVTKEGYVQKELRKILDIALEKPEETIFIIPLRLDECELPRRVRSLHYVDYFPPSQQDRAYRRLLQALNTRLVQLQPTRGMQDVLSKQVVDPNGNSAGKTPETRAIVSPAYEPQPVKRAGNVELAGNLLLMLYFVIAALESFSPSSDTIETLLGISAMLAGIGLLRHKQVPAGLLFRISLIIYLLIYGMGYRLTNTVPAAFYIAGAAASVAGIMVVTTAKMPGKHLFYSATAFALFLFLVAVYEFTTNVEYSAFTTIIDTLILLISIVTSVLIWMDV